MGVMCWCYDRLGVRLLLLPMMSFFVGVVVLCDVVFVKV